MKHTTHALPLLAIVLVFMTVPALAQSSKAPSIHAGDMAVSGNLGFANAFDNDFDGLEPILTGTFEYYTSDQISWRGSLGFTSFSADLPRGRSVDVDMTMVNANIVYAWQSDNLRPYVTGGVGLYDESSSRDLPGVGDGAELGFNLGGGLDLYLDPQWAIKFEGTFHGMSGDEPDSFFALTVGAKFNF